jgi:hypothetical protein
MRCTKRLCAASAAPDRPDAVAPGACRSIEEGSLGPVVVALRRRTWEGGAQARHVVCVWPQRIQIVWLTSIQGYCRTIHA